MERSIFLVIVPIGIFGAIWSNRRLKELLKKRQESFDFLGATLFSMVLILMLVALTVSDLRSLLTQELLGGSAVLFTIFLFQETRVQDPVLDLKIFSIRHFTAGNIASLLNGLAFAALAFELTLYLELVKGYSPLHTGIALIPMGVTLIVIGPISGRLSDKYGARVLSTLGLALTSVALLIFSTFSADTHVILITAALALAGLGIGMFRSPNAGDVMASAPPEKRGVGAGVRSTIINTSAVVSVPLALSLMTAVMPYDRLAVVVSATTMGSPPDTLRLLDALRYAFYAFAAINALGILASILRGPRATRDVLSDQEQAPQPHSGQM